MRLFIALEIPEGIRQRLGRRAGELRRRLPPARWVRPEGYHLTLLFLGEVGEGAAQALGGALGPVFAARPPFDLRFTGAGTFPARGRARVVWIGLEPHPVLVDLERGLRAAVSPLVELPGERRPYHPHLTLARCRRPWPDEAGETWRRELSGFAEEAVRVERGVLVRSHLGPGGARYEIVGAYPMEALP